MSDWKYDVDDVGPDAADDRSIEPGTPSVENAAFVLLGMLVTVLVFAQFMLTLSGT